MAVKTVLKAESIDVQAEMEARRKRAAEALQSGKYRVEKIEKGRWAVSNGEGITYHVTVKDGKVVCDCPDFQKRGNLVGTCKHIEMIRLSRSGGNATASASAAQKASAPAPAPNPGKPASQPTPAAKPAPNGDSTVEDPGEVVVHWGQYRGKKLAEVANEAPGFIGWLAFRMEAKSPQDEALQKAARQVYDRIKAKQSRKAKGARASSDPIAAFISAAGVELLREIWKAQSNGRNIEDPAMQAAIELRIQAIRLVAERLRQLE